MNRRHAEYLFEHEVFEHALSIPKCLVRGFSIGERAAKKIERGADRDTPPRAGLAPFESGVHVFRATLIVVHHDCSLDLKPISLFSS